MKSFIYLLWAEVCAISLSCMLLFYNSSVKGLYTKESESGFLQPGFRFFVLDQPFLLLFRHFLYLALPSHCFFFC